MDRLTFEADGGGACLIKSLVLPLFSFCAHRQPFLRSRSQQTHNPAIIPAETSPSRKETLARSIPSQAALPHRARKVRRRQACSRHHKDPTRRSRPTRRATWKARQRIDDRVERKTRNSAELSLRWYVVKFN